MTQRQGPGLALRGALALGACLLMVLCLSPLLLVDTGPSLEASTPEAGQPNTASVPTRDPVPGQPVPVDPDALQTQADRRYAAEYSRLLGTINDCGVQLGHLCHPGGCTSALYMPNQPLDQALMMAEAGWAIGEDVAQRTLNLPKGTLPCNRAIEDFIGLAKEQQSGLRVSVPTPTGTLKCGTHFHTHVELEGEALAQYERDQDRRCEILARTLGMSGGINVSEAREKQKQEEEEAG